MPNLSCTAAVIRPGLTWFSGALPQPLCKTTPDWARTDLARVVLAAQTVWFQYRAEGTVLWQCPMGEDPAAFLRDLVATLRARDCQVTETGIETGWFTIRHRGFPDVHLGIGGLIKQSRTTVTGLTDEAPLVATRLARYADVTGAAWRGTAGLSGTAAVRSLQERKDTSPLWKWKVPDNVPGMVGCSYELNPARHRRDITGTEYDLRWVHQFDVTAMYLAAAGNAMVGWSAPEHSGPREFDPGRAGYWQVRRDEVTAIHMGGLPTDVVVRDGSTALQWVTTPVMTYLTERAGHAPEVFDSWTCDRTGRYLRPWAERLTAARKTLDVDSPVDSVVLQAVKDTYARTVGMFGSPKSRVFRPDWRDTIVDLARINLVRKLNFARLVPLRYNVDSVWIATDREANDVLPDLGTLVLQGRQATIIGKFRHIMSMTPNVYAPRYQQGRVPV